MNKIKTFLSDVKSKIIDAIAITTIVVFIVLSLIKDAIKEILLKLHKKK